MNRSDSWLKIKSKFSQQLSLFKAGKLELDLLVKQLDSLLSENPAIDNDSEQEIEQLIRAEKLPEDVQKRLLDRVGDQKTHFFQAKSSVTPKEEKIVKKNSENHSSILLKDLSSPSDSSEITAIEVGQVIRGTYSIENKIGSGGMGDVWKALDLIQDAGDSRDKYVAIKFINQEIRRHPDALKALVREFGRYKKLIHPNIVRAYELNRDGNDVFIAMEYLEGLELKEFIKQHPKGIPLEQAEPIIKGMCDALEYAHNEGIVHLDFKPGNVFYNPEIKRCKVIDFGIARVSDDDERDKTRFDPGTLGAMTTAYASCEMLMELEPDPRDDIYGLACVIYELLSGQHPFNKKMALKAEREKDQIRPIPELSNNEFKAIQRGLAFNKENRTESAKDLYFELFEPQQLANQKKTKWIIIGTLVAGLLVAIPFAGYKGYHSWLLSDVKTSIEERKSSSVVDFSQLSVDDQKELLLNQGLRLSLIKNIVEVAGEKGALSTISKFDSYVQQLLFTDRNVREYLIISYQDKVERSINNDDFQQAELYSKNVVQYYPDSRQLVELTESIAQKKLARQTDLKYRYQQCLNDRSQQLVTLFSCFQETREAFKKIGGFETLLTPAKSGLTRLYSKEITTAINQKELSLAEILLRNWKTLESDDISSRTKLEQKLAYTNKVEQLIKQIAESRRLQLTEILITLTEQDKIFKNEILANTLVKQRLMKYYLAANDQFLNNHKYALATKDIADGMALLSKSKKELRELKKVGKKITVRKRSYLKSLEKNYKQELFQAEPNIQTIQGIQASFSEVEPKHPIVQLPKILESYSKKIDEAILKNKFELVERLFNDWKYLKPSDSEHKEFMALVNKKDKFLLAFKNRNKFTLQLEGIIQTNQLEKVPELMAEVKKELPKKDQKQFLFDNQQTLFDFYQQHIDLAIQQDKYELALNIFAQEKLIFPKNRTILKNEKNILSAKKTRIKELLTQSQQAMEFATFDAVEVFSPLDKVKAIDPVYFENSITIFQRLKDELIKRLEKDNTLLSIQGIIAKWNDFIIESSQSMEKNQELFENTKNTIALKCLFKGRKFKQQNLPEKANELFMFGLSLNPVNSVKNALEGELF